MAHRELLLFACLAKGAAEGRIKKQRVIAETAGSARLIHNDAFYRPFVEHWHARRLYQSDYANEARGPVAHAAQFFDEQQVVAFIGSAWSGEASRIDSRRAVERIHDQTGIVGEQLALHMRAIMLRLLDGIFGKCRAVFNALGNFAKSR